MLSALLSALLSSTPSWEEPGDRTSDPPVTSQPAEPLPPCLYFTATQSCSSCLCSKWFRACRFRVNRAPFRQEFLVIYRVNLSGVASDFHCSLMQLRSGRFASCALSCTAERRRNGHRHAPHTAKPPVIRKYCEVLSREIAGADCPAYPSLFQFTHDPMQDIYQELAGKDCMCERG